MKRKSAIAAVTAAALALSLAACGSSDSAAASSAAPVESTASSEAAPAEAAPAGDFDTDQDITVISREDGSGTRGAFIELTGVEEKNADGKKVDNTTEAAAIQSSTNGVMTAVANDETAIGYISLGSLNDPVKAVTVGGVAASAETVKDVAETAKEAAKDAAAAAEEGAKETAAEVKEAAGEVAKAAEGKKDEK